MGKMKDKKQENKTDLEQRKAQRLRGEKRKKRKELLVTIGIVVAGLAALVLILWKVSGAADEPAKTKAFSVGEDTVYMDEVNLYILQNVMNLGMDSQSLSATVKDGNTADVYYKQEIMDMIMDYKVEASVAQKEGLVLTNEEQTSVKNDVADYLNTVNGSVLRELGITQELISKVYEQRYLARKLEETVTDELETEEVTYCTMYMMLFPKIEMDENGDYVKEEDGKTPVMLSEEDISKKEKDAQAAYEEVKNGADVEEIAKKYGVEAYSGEESNTPDSFGDDFSEYAKNLKEGECSPVIDTASCYAILKMITVNDEELADRIQSYYRCDLEKEAVEENRTKWYDEAGISKEDVWTSKDWDSVSLYDFVKYVEE